jgi:putative oxidoreductase
MHCSLDDHSRGRPAQTIGSIGDEIDELHRGVVANLARPSHRADQQIPDRPLGPVPLRLIVGYGFMEHGFAKLARGPDAFPAIVQAIGVPAPHLMGWLTILVEIFGGLAVLLGALVPLASIPMAAVLLVAMFTVHLPYGFSSIKLQAVTAAGTQFGPPGFETDLLYLACLSALVLAGSGPLAIDSLLAKRREHMRPSSHAEPPADGRGAGRTNRVEAQSEAAESHASGPMPLSRAATHHLH